jgi:hypothetical protein
MPQRLSHVLWSRLVLLAWLTPWTLAVPLFHIHPEADHHHGQPGHVHSGLSHTVFSSDLSCEYASGEGQAVTSQHDVSRQPFQVGQSRHSLDHPEIAFSLLTSSRDRSGEKPIVVAASTWGTEGDIVLFPSACNDLSADKSHPSVLLSAALSTRAPPVLSL